MPAVASQPFAPAPDTTLSAAPLLFLEGRGITAQGRDAAEGFVAYDGSFASRGEVASLHEYVRTQRANLLASGVLVTDGDRLRVTQDYTFNSPSTAAVLLGRSSNGRVDWKDSSGTTLGHGPSSLGHRRGLGFALPRGTSALRSSFAGTPALGPLPLAYGAATSRDWVRERARQPGGRNHG